MFVKSISYKQEEILQWILYLHCTSPIELDPTYSTGNFYKGAIEEPIYKFDILPQSKGVVKASSEALPLNDESICTMIFDPPFLATKGKSLSIPNKSNRINKRFGVFPSEEALFRYYTNSLKEFFRILKPGGVLIFKCQDKVSGGKQYFSHNWILNEANHLGFYAKDLFVLLAKQRLVANWQKKNQKHARKYHAYFWVLKKTSKHKKSPINGLL